MKHGKYIIIILLLTMVAIAFYLFIFSKTPISIPEVIIEDVLTPQEQEEMKNEQIEKLQAANEVIAEMKKTDQDLDGLSDEEESNLKTNPNDTDTDGDGLLDGYEVNIFKTDPLKNDTDGDGYTDGEEVNNGYSPLGSGKLIR